METASSSKMLYDHMMSQLRMPLPKLPCLSPTNWVI
jgi:hypothetical protein